MILQDAFTNPKTFRLKDYFAAQALVALVQRSDARDTCIEDLAKQAYDIAEAMMDERSERGPS